MATPRIQSESTLRLERTFTSPPAKVFAAWTSAEALSRWFAPTDDYACAVAPFEPRTGGRYRVEMRHKGGAVHPVSGRYLEVVPPSRLVFTWAWEDRPEEGEQLVTVEFQPDGAGTRLVLTHERFPNASSRDRHAEGWEGCLGRLARIV